MYRLECHASLQSVLLHLEVEREGLSARGSLIGSVQSPTSQTHKFLSPHRSEAAHFLFFKILAFSPTPALTVSSLAG